MTEKYKNQESGVETISKSDMLFIKKCWFCENIKHNKNKCLRLKIYKTIKKIHLNNYNILIIKLADRNERYASFVIKRPQIKLINEILKIEK